MYYYIIVERRNKMLLKRLYIRLLAVWQYLITSYDNSIIGKNLSKFCMFFENKIRASVICTYFREKFFDMSLIKHSIFAKIISLPFNLMRRFYSKAGSVTEHMVKESKTARFVTSLAYIPAYYPGVFLTFFGISALAGSFLTGGITFLEVLLSSVFIVCGIFFLPVKETIYNLFISSLAGKALMSLFVDANTALSDKKEEFLNKKIILLTAIVLGLICGASNLLYMSVLIAALVVIALIVYNTYIGIFLLVISAPILPTMAVAGLSCLCILSYALHLATAKDASYKMTPFSPIIAAFLVLVGITSITGKAPQSSIPAFLIYAIFTLTFPVITNTVKTQKQWNILISAFALSAFLVALYGVVQNFVVSETTQSWVDASMFGDIKTRVFSTLGNPNVLGQFLILAIPLVVACTIYCTELKAKIIYIAILATMVACLWFTWSRAAWVGVAVAVVIMLTKKDRRFLGVCLIGFLFMLIILPQSIIHRLTSIGNTGDTSTAYRVSIWLGSLGVVRKFFFTGVGLGAEAFASAYSDFSLGGADFAQHAHNFYLQLVCDMGIGGLVLFILMILVAYKCISLAGKGNKLTNLVAYGCAGSFIGYMFQGFAETMWYNYRMLLVFWIFMALVRLAAEFGSPAKGVERID